MRTDRSLLIVYTLLAAAPSSSSSLRLRSSLPPYWETCFACFISVGPISREADGVLTGPVIGDDKLGVPGPMRFATTLM